LSSEIPWACTADTDSAAVIATVSREGFIVFMSLFSKQHSYFYLGSSEAYELNAADRSIQQKDFGNGLPQMHRNVRTGRIRPKLAVD